MISQNGRKLGWSVLNVVGPMARSVSDMAFFYKSCIGAEPMDPLAFPNEGHGIWPQPQVDLSSIRIGYTDDLGCCIVDPMIKRVFHERIKALSPHVKSCEPITLNLGDPDRAFDVLRAEGFIAQVGEQFEQDPLALSPNVRENMEIAIKLTLADRAWAHLEQTRIMQAFANQLQKVDIILSPVTPVTPFPWQTLFAQVIDDQPMRNYYHWLALTYVVTLSTHPALALPTGLDEAGMPFGLQLVAGLYEDGRLMAIGSALEFVLNANPETARPTPCMQRLQADTANLKSIVTHPAWHADN
jgi:amidase